MTPTLRPYQQQGISEIRDAYARGHRSVLFVLPTGGGKTVLFSSITQQTASRGNRVCVLVHRQELLRQASASLAAMGVPHGLIAANRSMDLSKAVQIASVQTLARRLHKLPRELFKLLVVDEAHHSNAGTWAKVLQHHDQARVLGVTATPCRSDGRGLGEFYSAMVQGPTAQWLTDHGFLAPAKVLAPPGFQVQGLRKRMGDYDMRQAADMLGQGQALGDALAHYRQHLNGQTAIAFCCSISHAQAVAELFNRHGIAAASIDGTMDSLTRERLLADLGAGRLKVLTSCALIGEGVDVPSVAGCILLRPTQSVALHLQMIGRCLRPQDGKRAVILDHVGNTLRLGHHLEDREWTLEGIQKRDREKAPSVKVCPSCFAAMPSGKPICPECGHEFTPERRELEHVDGELVELITDPVQKRKCEEWIERRIKEWLQLPVYLGDPVFHPDTNEPGYIVKQKGGSWAQINKKDSMDGVDVPLAMLVKDEAAERAATKLRWLELNRENLFIEERQNATTLEQLIDVGRRRGMKNPRGWAMHVLAARQAKGHWAVVA